MVLKKYQKDLGTFRLALEISYDGTDFGGWQNQSTGAPSIQYHIEKLVTELFGVHATVVGASRTDRGVHSRGQMAHVDIPHLINAPNLAQAFNSRSPEGLVLKKIWLANEYFHANLSCIKKTYTYTIDSSAIFDPIVRRHRAWVPRTLDVGRLNEMSALLLGRQDFSAFQNAGNPPPKTTVRHIYKAVWTEVAPQTFEFTVCGNAFLKQMVRNIVAAQLECLKEINAAAKFAEILAAQRRSGYGKPAPAQGLVLEKVEYPQAVTDLWIAI